MGLTVSVQFVLHLHLGICIVRSYELIDVGEYRGLVRRHVRKSRSEKERPGLVVHEGLWRAESSKLMFLVGIVGRNDVSDG